MAGHEKFYKQLIEKLRMDVGTGSLVELTHHSTEKLRIRRAFKISKNETPCLVVHIENSRPVSEYIPQIQRARVFFRCYGKDLTSIKIADRLERLLNPEVAVVGNNVNREYYDFSGVGISVRMTRFRNRVGPEYYDEIEASLTSVEMVAIWNHKQCV